MKMRHGWLLVAGISIFCARAAWTGSLAGATGDTKVQGKFREPEGPAMQLSLDNSEYQRLADVPWTTGARLITPRSNASVNLLPNGKILIAGGSSSGYFSLSSAEIYDLATNSWTLTGAMAQSREYHSGVFLPNGLVLVAGGKNAAGYLQTSELYDAKSGKWSSAGTILPQAYHTGTLLHDGRVLLCGGYTGSASAQCQIYTPSVSGGPGVWTTTGSLNTARYSHTATLLPNGDVMVYGGATTGNVLLSSTEIYHHELGTWSYGLSHTPARRDHISILLPNGKTLVAGGSIAGTTTYEAALYDYLTDTWTSTANMDMPLERHSAVLMPDGKVMVSGGQYGGVNYATVLIFDPAQNGGAGGWTGSTALPEALLDHTSIVLPEGKVMVIPSGRAHPYLWEKPVYSAVMPPDMSTSRQYHTASLLKNGKILIAGGRIGYTTYLSSCELFDPSTQSWSTTGSMTTPRSQHTATVLSNGKVVVIGGVFTNSNYTSSVELFDPAGNSGVGSWTSMTPLPWARALHSATLLASGEILVATGNAAGNTTDCLLFDPAANSGQGAWRTTGSMAVGRVYHTATRLMNGNVLVTGGCSTGYPKVAELYDALAGTWRMTGSLEVERCEHTATLLSSGQVLVAGGKPQTSNATSSVELYDPSTESWSTLLPMGFPRSAHAATLLRGDKVLVVGGRSGGTYDATCEIYDSLAWTRIQNLIDARYSHTATLLLNGDVLVAGGSNATALASAQIYAPEKPPAERMPAILSITDPIIFGNPLVLSGQRFKGDSEASTGGRYHSALNYPLLQLRALENDQITWLFPDPLAKFWDEPLALTVSDFSTDLSPGCYRATVSTHGVQSDSKVVCALCSLAITSHPRDAVAGVGETATFTIVAPGATHFQWQVNGSNIDGANAAVYTTPPVDPDGNGDIYRCIVWNACTPPPYPVSNGAKLTVLDEADPVVALVAPNGGESWAYSASEANRQSHLIVWEPWDNFELLRTRLKYTADGITWSLIEDSGADGAYAGPALPISDGGEVASVINIPKSGSILDIDVKVNISHPRDEDLTLSLIGPDATEITLSDQEGAGGHDYLETSFNDEAEYPISSGAPPYTGSFRPTEPLSAFDGKTVTGNWSLKIVDHTVNGATGSLNSWNISFALSGNPLGPDDSNFLWQMPTQAEAGSRGQIFPSATSKIMVEVWDGSSNYAFDTSDANFYIVQPTTTSIKTLVAWDSKRICERFDQSPPDPACTCASATTDPDCNVTYSLSNKLIELKDHEKVSGVVLDLAAVPAVQAAYAAWDAEPLIITHANDTASAIRDYLMAQANNTYTNTQYLILVGNDHQVPFYRMNDGATIYPESEYPAEVGLNTGTPVGFALSQGYFLTDNYYSELTPEASGMPTPHEWVYQNDFATGRLVETPEQIEGLINTFLAQNGQVNALPDPTPSPNKKNRVLVTGLDFLHDGATKNAQEYDQRGYTPAEDLDTLIDDPAPGQTGDDYTSAMLEAQLFPTAGGENMHYIANINTHANHYSFAASSGTAKLYCTDPAYDAAQCHATGIDANPKDLKSSILYTSGCHSGLNVDDFGPDTMELDLPEVMAGKGVVGYIGNTGYGWGLRNGRGLTETLMEKITDAILDNKSISIGKALSQAKRNYFLNEKRWDVFDEKVMHELTLFGIPNYLVVTGDLEAMRTPKEELPLPEGPDKGCANGICLEKKLTRGGNGLRVPGGVMALDLNFTMCSGACTPCPPPACTYDLHQTQDGYYYTLNTRASGEVGDTLQPQFIFNAYLSDINAHGVIFTGGHYLTDPGAFDPVIAVPRSTNDDSDEGPLPATSGWTPSLRVSFGCASGLGLRGNIGEVGYTNMLVYTGMCEDYQVDTCTQSRFKDMQFVIYYSNYSDVTAPLFATKGHTVSSMTATFTSIVTDASGVYRVLVTYRDKRETRWSTLELANTTGNQWTGTLELTGDTLYYWQAVDNAGNVGIPSASGPDKAGAPYPPETPYGSTWSGPEEGEIVLPDGDTDGLPDAYEDLHACLNKTVGDSGGDPDFDELTSLEEFHLGTNPCLADSDGDGDNDGSELNNAKQPLLAGDGDHLTLWPVKQAPGDLLLKWYRGTDNGTSGGAACDPGVSSPPCFAIGDNDAMDGHFRVYVSMDPRFSTNDYRIGPDGDLDDGAYDLDQDDQREYLLMNSTFPAEYQSAPILYFQTLNWDILVNAPLIETVVRNGAYFTIFGQYFHATGSEALLCEAADTCDSPIPMAITSQSDERIQATAPGGVTGMKYVAVRNPDGLMDIYSTPYSF